MKKILSIASTFLLIFALFSVTAVSAEPAYEEKEGTTIFVPLQLQQQIEPSQFKFAENITPYANPMGTIDCEATTAGGAICDWRVAAGFKKINFSNVTVTFDKWNSATLTWEYSTTKHFKYGVNPPKSVIEDQAGIGMLSSGFYRAKLGGTITTVSDGTFVASASAPATFNVK